MSLTLTDVQSRLKMLEETILVEVLDISSEDIVERFGDFIEAKFEELQQELNWDE